MDRRVTEIDDRLEDLGDPELEEAYLLEMEKISLISKNPLNLKSGQRVQVLTMQNMVGWS